MKKSRRLWFFRIAVISLVVLLVYRCDILFPPDVDDSTNTVKDIDGNEYTTVTIGSQVWMVENLKTTRYNDGTLIQFLAVPNDDQDGAYCFYNNDLSFKNQYGALYNWYAAKSTKLAPVGWHVPDYADWQLLKTFLGNDVAAKLQETGPAHWMSPSNNGATNESGFTALPAGWRDARGSYFMGTGAGWWSSSMPNPISWPGFFQLSDGNFGFSVSTPGYNCSVRCLKNDVPSVTTEAVSGITASTVLTGGKITIKGGTEIILRGVCWNTSHDPTTFDSKTSDPEEVDPDGWKPGTFKSTITGLLPNTTYYLRAYATNSDGTGYGNEVTFKTLP